MCLGVLVGGTGHARYWQFSHLHRTQLKTAALISVLPNQGQALPGQKKAVHLSRPKPQHQQLDLI